MTIKCRIIENKGNGLFMLNVAAYTTGTGRKERVEQVIKSSFQECLDFIQQVREEFKKGGLDKSE